MKKILFSLLVLVIGGHVAKSQSTSQQVANKIASRMKDSLSLSTQQKDQLYSININLSDQKAVVRQQYTGSDSVSVKIQRIENTRDSLYRPVLGEEKFLLYKQRKRNLVNNN